MTNEQQAEWENALRKVVYNWQDGSLAHVKAAARELLGTSSRMMTDPILDEMTVDKADTKAAEIILEAIADKGKTFDAPIYRGLKFESSVWQQTILANAKVGDEFELVEPQSFSTDYWEARVFAKTFSKVFETVMLTVDAGAKGFDIVGLTDSRHNSEKEVITNGRFRIEKIEHSETFPNLEHHHEYTLKQIEPLTSYQLQLF